MSKIISSSSYLQAMRKIRGYTQQQLADLTGVNLRMIQGYEQGTKDINKASFETAYKICVSLEIPFEELLIYNEDIASFNERFERIRFKEYYKKK